MSNQVAFILNEYGTNTRFKQVRFLKDKTIGILKI